MADDKHQTRRARTARFYHAGELNCQSELILSKSASHHLVTVLRKRKNDDIQLFNGDGFNYCATIIDTGQRAQGKCALLHMHDRHAVNTESAMPITLVQAISRNDRMDITLRQAVELGVQHIQPLYSRHSAKPLDDKRSLKKQEHWQSIVISACEQSGRAKLPSLAQPMGLNQWLDARCSSDQTRIDYVLTPHATQSLMDHVLHNHTSGAPAGLLIGPESGFDNDEVEDAQTQGVHAVRFGPRVLRTETAGPAAIAVLQSSLGDLGSNSS
ncbi:MAG: 16S rRNA (uracil(1498)-N(3))-methyltransferase [Granulosicoccus sp.]